MKEEETDAIACDTATEDSDEVADDINTEVSVSLFRRVHPILTLMVCTLF